jgi:hypothetical protein
MINYILGGKSMIKKEIYELRSKLNKLITEGADYSLIKIINEKLDGLIIEYYRAA